MRDEVRERPNLTRKGERTRGRIVEAAARLIHQRSVAGTRLEDVRAAAAVSGSQLSHYFVDKDELVKAVVDHRADAIVANQRGVDLAGTEGLRAWRDLVIAEANRANGLGGCPLGSLAGQLAESDPEARARVANGFDRWSAALSDGLRSLRSAGHLPLDVDPEDLAVTLLAALQGGLLLAQIERDTRPLVTAIDTLLDLVSRATKS